MRAAFVNLPHPTQVIRRYMCSYNSPMFLFPPLELMWAATSARELAGTQVRVFDAIADRSTIESLKQKLVEFNPDLVVTIMGFEIFEQDARALSKLRRDLPNAKFAAFGHYPTTFPTEVMDVTGVDYVLRGEPEFTTTELLQAMSSGGDLSTIAGLNWRDAAGNLQNNPERPRIKHVDELPDPDYGLVDVGRYSEFMLDTPFAALQTSRGCPYTCNYCVRSYGQKLTLRSPGRIIGELQNMVDRFGIRSFRFTDDTFTAIPTRTMEICEGIQKAGLKLTWSCLSRIDTMDQARADALKAAGCVRVYIGVESGSERILKLYGKEYDTKHIRGTVNLLRKTGVEVGSFFMVGHPEETQEDFEHTSRLIRSLELDYATVGRTVPYPGTEFFDRYRDQLDFSLFPYRNEWKDANRTRQLLAWERRFMREMYLRPSYVARNAWRMIKNAKTTAKSGWAMLPFLFGNGASESARNEFI